LRRSLWLVCQLIGFCLRGFCPIQKLRGAANCKLWAMCPLLQRGTLAELVERTGSLTLKGEVVVLIDRAASGSINQEDIVSALRRALQSMSVRDASETVAQAYGLPKRKIYQMALEFDKEEDR
jgi:16S rRNA (cytidine1402-2'-O)-methyltransferase